MISVDTKIGEKRILLSVAKVLVFSLIVTFFVSTYFLGVFSGYIKGRIEVQEELLAYQNVFYGALPTTAVISTPTPKLIPTKAPGQNVGEKIVWGGLSCGRWLMING